MTHFFITLTSTLVLVCLDFLLRGDLIKDNITNYCIVGILLFGFIYFSRLTLILIKNRMLTFILGIIFIVLFSTIYWIQSVVYAVYFQFISAADIGIVIGNLKYWQQGANKLISFINTQWLFTYLIIFSLTFLYQSNKQNLQTSRLIQKNIFGFVLVFITSITSLFYIKKHQLHYLTTPALSLTHEIRRFSIEKHRFMKEVKVGTEEDYYARETDQIPEFNRRGDFNILLLILESLRQDHMSLYGYERDTTPFQKQRFKDSFHFANAISNTTSTDTSAELIFTGIDRTNDNIHSTSLLWSYFKAAKFNQFYVGSHWLQWNGWFGRAFLSEDVDSIQAPLAVDASLTGYDMTSARKFKTTLAQFSQKDQPFFGVVHFAGTHYPYVAPEEYRKWFPAKPGFDADKVNELINQYDNSILYNDDAVKIVVAELTNLNIQDNTIIIVTADHAEAMYEHKQFFHGKVFWQEGIHVPLYIDIPNALQHHFTNNELRNLKSNASNFVSIVDIFPTILDLYEIPAAKKLDGFSLLKPYPEDLIRVYMIPEEYALINSHTGEKFHVDNAKKVLLHTKLRDDPNEKNSTKIRTQKNYSIHKMIELVKSKKVYERFNLNR